MVGWVGVGVGGGGGGWVGGGGSFFVNIKDWQSQSIKDVPVLKVSLVEI